jgi:hypothetical protein
MWIGISEIGSPRWVASSETDAVFVTPLSYSLPKRARRVDGRDRAAPVFLTQLYRTRLRMAHWIETRSVSEERVWFTSLTLRVTATLERARYITTMPFSGYHDVR